MQNGGNNSVQLDVERIVLPNGLILLLSENHRIPAVSINAIVKAGSRYESDDQAGLASFVGEMLSEGTHSRTSQQIALAIESVGGIFITAGGYNQSGVSATALSKDFDLALTLTADVLMNAGFPDDRVKQQIDKRIAQIRSRRDEPQNLGLDHFNELIARGHPRHRPEIGYEETIARLSRQELMDFYRRFYIPNNTIIAVVGDIDKAEARRKIEEAFINWRPDPDFIEPSIPEISRQTAPITRFVNVDKAQVNIFIGHLGIKRNNPDYYTLQVLDVILGSSPGFTSRIPRILRDEQGLAYTTYASITRSAGLDPGQFIAYIGTSPEFLPRAIGGIRREIERIVIEDVTEEELEDAKAYLTGSFVFEFETNAQIAAFLVSAEIYGLGFDYLQRYPELINRVSVRDVRRAAQEYIDPENLTVVVVGPVEEQE